MSRDKYECYKLNIIKNNNNNRIIESSRKYNGILFYHFFSLWKKFENSHFEDYLYSC